MFREKSVIKITKVKDSIIYKGAWKIKGGSYTSYVKMGISRLLRLISTYIEDKDKIQSIEIIVKRRKK